MNSPVDLTPENSTPTPILRPSASAFELRSVDRDLLLTLRGGDMMGIGELTTLLGVTATAVRQRIERLLEQGLIEREKIVAGRGRPTYRYKLTITGHQRSGANPAQLADAMWREILAIPDTQIRERLITSIAERLGREFAAQFALEAKGSSLEDRMNRLAEILSDQQIESAVISSESSTPLPILDICSCPYPSLADSSDERAMCRLEEQMISEALGEEVQLSSCRLDGDSCCQFSMVAPATDTANN